MTRLRPSMVKGMVGEIVDRAALSPPTRTESPPTFFIQPWDSGQYVYPRDIYQDHGFTTYYAEFNNNLYTTFLVTNALDATTYIKKNDKGFQEVLTNPDLILGPMKSNILTVNGENVGIVSCVAGCDYETQRALLSSKVVDQFYFNLRGPAAGVYFSDPDKQPVLNMPEKWMRRYDIYDISNAYPASAPTFAHSAQKGFSPTAAIDLPLTMSAPTYFRALDGTGASGVTAGIHIATVTAGAGSTGTLYLVKKYVIDPFTAPQLRGFTVNSVTFTVTADTTVNMPVVSGGLENDLMLMLSGNGIAVITIDQMFVNFTMS